MKNHILNMEQVTKLSDAIKSEGLQYKQTLEEEGKSSGEIMPDVVPTSQSYRDAVSPPPSKKWGRERRPGFSLATTPLRANPLKRSALATTPVEAPRPALGGLREMGAPAHRALGARVLRPAH